MKKNSRKLGRRAALKAGLATSAALAGSSRALANAPQEAPHQTPVGFTLARETSDIEASADIETAFDKKLCIHARHCLTRLSEVFRPFRDPWMDPEAAHPDQIAGVIEMCPSGALQYNRLDGGRQETVPNNIISVRENGPLEVRGEMYINGEEVGYRRTLCRCGMSANKPYCDFSHRKARFEATGEIEPAEDPGYEAYLAYLGNPKTRLDIQTEPGEPYLITGSVQLCSGTGARIECGDSFALCSCGKSASKPYCDGSHAA